MKALITLILIAATTACFAQGYGDYPRTKEEKVAMKQYTDSVKVALSNDSAADCLRRGGNQLVAAQLLTIGSGVMIALWANSNNNDTSNPNEKKQNNDAMLYAAGGVGFVALVLQLSGYSNIAKAGKLMANGKYSAQVTASGNGIGVTFTF